MYKEVQCHEVDLMSFKRLEKEFFKYLSTGKKPRLMS